MPLPGTNAPWPPPQWASVFDDYRKWDAWYAGDTDRLAQVYGADTAGPNVHRSQYAGGVVGRMSRWFWGTPQRQQQATKLHTPVAADIAATSADLLFAEPPELTLNDEGDTATQDRLAELFGPEAVVSLLEAAEIASALGGVYLRGVWDRDLADKPFPSPVSPDVAIPTFRWGKLAEVTFARTVAQDDNAIWRHLEHHTPGGVQHGLYRGNYDTLGRPVPLTDDPATAGLADSVGDDGVTIETGLDTLDVVYVPNVTPNRRWRSHAQARSLGRSDFDGIEHLMDALDETYTSWMRDIRLAKARILAPSSYLETDGRGQGARFDTEREVFTSLNILGGKDNVAISAQQFEIRAQEHRDTAYEWWSQVIRGAGYSAQTFGSSGDVAMTATETNARERATMRTRGKKVRLWRMALSQMAYVLLGLDREQFGTSVTPQRPNVVFPPVVTETVGERAETAKMIRDAEAASTRTLVQTVNPDWSDDDVDDEVERINAEHGAIDQDPDVMARNIANGPLPQGESSP